MRLPLIGGKGLLIKRSGSYLCVALKGVSGGIGSLGLCYGDTIRILHASTGLITANYVNDGDRWHSVFGFRGPEVRLGEEYGRGEIRQSEEYRNANLLQFGWYANLVELGPPDEMEYLIDFAYQNPGAFRLSAVFFQVRADEKYAFLPAGLSDATLDHELIAGSARSELAFIPSQWQSLVW
jgi:hypothetical protein